MKLLKVGSSPSCDIVINNPYVSAHHANITVLDNGEIIIEDRGSSNGTFVGVQNNRLTPGQEVTIHRGDRVTLANEPLPWNKVPQPTVRRNVKRIVNIGSSQRNDVVVPGNVVSRYHAMLIIDNKGKAFIIDNKSTNGTQVNGLKITPERPTPIKRGDNIIIGGEDITDRVAEFLPKSGRGALIGIIAGATTAAVAAIIALILWLLPAPLPEDNAVVFICNTYHYEVTLENNPYNLPINLKLDPITVYGTGFFIDRQGRIATNRHVACPWFEEYQEINESSNLKIQDEIKKEWAEFLDDNIPSSVNSDSALAQLASTPLGESIIEAAISNNSSNKLSSLNNILAKLHSSPIKVTGVNDKILVAYSGRHYTNFDEFEPAVVVAESGDKDKDVAIIQLNTLETPSKVKNVFNIKGSTANKPGVQKEELLFKGYPSGITRTWDEHINVSDMVPTTYKGKCIRNNDPYGYELQVPTTGGASGSPVYGEDGKFYGIITSVYRDNKEAIFTPARWVEELYNEKINF